MPCETLPTPRTLSSEELELVAGGHDATIMPVVPPVTLKPDVPPPHLPRVPDVPPPNDIRGPNIPL
ncbi:MULTISPECIES: hypothetical protein [unclassified Pseudomonas]|uniref:hypothetical protein n=1 Tax=unclassified Pseudomonas TaxID=196821 RepID=UPI002D5DCCC2|nr:hypothetical protein [Pseudomonas sp.]